MLYLLPFLTLFAAIISGVLLYILWDIEELRGYKAIAHFAWFVAAGYCQLFGSTATMTSVGLAGQTALAIVLLVRWKISS